MALQLPGNIYLRSAEPVAAYRETSQPKVRNSVRAGPPTCTVDRTVFELWLGTL